MQHYLKDLKFASEYTLCSDIAMYSLITNLVNSWAPIHTDMLHRHSEDLAFAKIYCSLVKCVT